MLRAGVQGEELLFDRDRLLLRLAEQRCGLRSTPDHALGARLAVGDLGELLLEGLLSLLVLA